MQVICIAETEQGEGMVPLSLSRDYRKTMRDTRAGQVFPQLEHHIYGDHEQDNKKQQKRILIHDNS